MSGFEPNKVISLAQISLYDIPATIGVLAGKTVISFEDPVFAIEENPTVEEKEEQERVDILRWKIEQTEGVTRKISEKDGSLSLIYRFQYESSVPQDLLRKLDEAGVVVKLVTIPDPSSEKFYEKWVTYQRKHYPDDQAVRDQMKFARARNERDRARRLEEWELLKQQEENGGPRLIVYLLVVMVLTITVGAAYGLWHLFNQ